MPLENAIRTYRCGGASEDLPCLGPDDFGRWPGANRRAGDVSPRASHYGVVQSLEQQAQWRNCGIPSNG